MSRKRARPCQNIQTVPPAEPLLSATQINEMIDRVSEHQATLIELNHTEKVSEKENSRFIRLSTAITDIFTNFTKLPGAYLSQIAIDAANRRHGGALSAICNNIEQVVDEIPTINAGEMAANGQGVNVTSSYATVASTPREKPAILSDNTWSR